MTVRWDPLGLNVIAYRAFVPPDFSRWIISSNSGKHHAGPASLAAGTQPERKICHIETQEVGEHTPPKHVAITTNVIRSVCAWQVSKARDVGSTQSPTKWGMGTRVRRRCAFALSPDLSLERGRCYRLATAIGILGTSTRHASKHPRRSMTVGCPSRLMDMAI